MTAQMYDGRLTRNPAEVVAGDKLPAETMAKG